jgi:Negative regulator of sigma F
VQKELGRPLRAWWLGPACLALANALLGVVAASLLEPWNWGASTSPAWLFLGAATLLLLLTTAGAFLAFAPRRRWPGALGLSALAAAGVLLAADGHADNAHFLEGATCLVTVVVLSILPLAGGAFLLTRMAYSPPRALAVGLLCAGVGLLVLQFHCTDGARPHLLVFHLLPWAALGAAAVLLRRLLPTRSHAP